MVLKSIVFYLPLISSAVYCLRSSAKNDDLQWPVTYANTDKPPAIYDPSEPLSIYMDIVRDKVFMVSNEIELFPISKTVKTFDQHADISKELMFISLLCKTTNCRESLDVWDCPECEKVLPDAVVVRSFKTFPHDVTGHILRSPSLKTLFIQIRGANSDNNRVLWSQRRLVKHPFIPKALVQEGYLTAALDIRKIIYDTLRDQMALYPDYKVVVASHSFGAAVGSLVSAHLKFDIPQLNTNNFKAYLLGKPRVGNYDYAKFFADEGIKVLRVINALDDEPHQPSIRDGFVHEGDEYWLKYYSSNGELELMHCPGPFETRNCSNSAPYYSTFEHSEVFGVQESCLPDGSLRLNFTALMERLASDSELTPEELEMANQVAQGQLTPNPI
ncbi:Alpha/Beta hydrolase protein [Sporodiniella umbellata]|nr:Alpha/Beta hydrolase protein [Sporodiniella umbellata]